MHLKDLLRKPDVACICNFVPRYIRPTTTMQEICERRQASLERYRQQYALEHGNDDFEEERMKLIVVVVCRINWKKMYMIGESLMTGIIIIQHVCNNPISIQQLQSKKLLML